MEANQKSYYRLRDEYLKVASEIPEMIKRQEELSDQCLAVKYQMETDLWKSIKPGDTFTNGVQSKTIVRVRNGEGGFMSTDSFYLESPIVEAYGDKRQEIFKSWINPIDGYMTKQGWKIIHQNDEHGNEKETP